MNYDAELHNVTSAPVIGERLWGVIFADSKGRFRVEAVTDSSTVYRAASTERYVFVSQHPDTIYAIQGDIITTANTTYKMVNS